MVKNPPANAGDLRDAGRIPGSGRSPGGGHCNPLQYSRLENPHGQRGAWRDTVHRVANSTQARWNARGWFRSRALRVRGGISGSAPSSVPPLPRPSPPPLPPLSRPGVLVWFCHLHVPTPPRVRWPGRPLAVCAEVRGRGCEPTTLGFRFLL